MNSNTVKPEHFDHVHLVYHFAVPLGLSVSITLVDVLQKWLSWFHLLFFAGGPLIILIDCMIFQSPFLDVTRMSMSAVSFLPQVGSGILCL